MSAGRVVTPEGILRDLQSKYRGLGLILRLIAWARLRQSSLLADAAASLVIRGTLSAELAQELAPLCSPEKANDLRAFEAALPARLAEMGKQRAASFEEALKSGNHPKVREVRLASLDAFVKEGNAAEILQLVPEVLADVGSAQQGLLSTSAACHAVLSTNAHGLLKRYAERLLNYSNTPAARTLATCYGIIFDMINGNSRDAIEAVLSLDPSLIAPQQVPGLFDFVVASDFGWYVTVMAMALLPRAAIKTQLLDSETYHALVSGVPEAVQLVEAYQQCRFAEWSAQLNRLEQRLRCDPFLRAGLDRNNFLVGAREKAIVQYFRPFSRIRISAIATALDLPEADMERTLATLIRQKQIQARIDANERVVIATTADARAVTYRDAVEVCERYIERAENILLRASLAEQKFKLKEESQVRDGP